MIRAVVFGVLMGFSLVAKAQSVLIENVRIFDGVGATLTPGRAWSDAHATVAGAVAILSQTAGHGDWRQTS